MPLAMIGNTQQSMNQTLDIQSLARQSGATSEDGGPAEHVFMFTAPELHEFAQRLTSCLCAVVDTQSQRAPIRMMGETLPPFLVTTAMMSAVGVGEPAPQAKALHTHC